MSCLAQKKLWQLNAYLILFQVFENLKKNQKKEADGYTTDQKKVSIEINIQHIENLWVDARVVNGGGL
jgi:CRISPR/Cas system-associated exonuclease Cas4 (RecB family)